MSAENPYDFIVNPEMPKKSLRVVLSKQRLPFIIGGAIVAIIILVIFGSIFSRLNDNSDEFLKVLQSQTELARVTSLPVMQKDNNSATKNVAANVQQSMTSSYAQLSKLLSERGANFDSKELTLAKDIKTDQTLDAAYAAGNFDTTLASILDKQLHDYQLALQNAHTASKSSTVKDLLSAQFNDANLLLKQVETIR